MVDPGEQVSVTLRREFMEEALDSTQATGAEVQKMEAMVREFFSSGVEVYKGKLNTRKLPSLILFKWSQV